MTRSVQFRQQVERVVPLPLPIAIIVIRLFHLDDALLRVNALDRLPFIRPVPEPVAVHPRVRFINPSGRPVFLVDKLPCLAALVAVNLMPVLFHNIPYSHKTLIRPPGQSHRLVREE